MKGFIFTLSAILSGFVPLSFYCCLSGTILTLMLLPFCIKYNNLQKPLTKLATIFALLWILNIIANFYLLFSSPNM